MYEMEERLSGTEDMIEETDSSVKENSKINSHNTKCARNMGHMKRPNLRILGIE